MSFNIGIAGCGVAGLTAALLLARAGHRVTIHEQSPSLAPVGAGVLLQPSGQLILQALGLLDQVTANAEPIARLTALTHTGKTLIDLPYSDLAQNAHSFGLLRSDLFSVLHAAALAEGVTIKTNQRIHRHIALDDGVYFTEADFTRSGPYDFVLATDGARSNVREHLIGMPNAIKFRAHPYPHGALFSMGPCSAISNRLWQVCRGTRELCGILPTGNRQASLFWSIRNDQKDSLRARGFAPWKSEVLSLCPQAEEIFSTVTTWDHVAFVSYMHIHMPRPFDSHCLFLGDAAHAMSPHLGQGINLALIDAFTFAAALAQAGTFPAACQLYTRQRAAHLRAYRIITYFLSPFFQSRGIFKGLARDLFLPLMPKFPPLRRQMVLTMSGLRANLLGGQWQLGVPCPAVRTVSQSRS